MFMASTDELQGMLQRIGLSAVESKIYVVLLRTGKARAGEIAKITGLNRTSTYNGLKGLLEKGLAAYVVEANRKMFSAMEPRRLVGFTKEKEEQALEVSHELMKVYKVPEEKHNVTLYYGKRGIKTMFLDMLKEGKTNDVLDWGNQLKERMPEFEKFLIKQFEKRRIHVRHVAKHGIDVTPSKTTELRFLPTKSTSNVTTNIYGRKTAIIVWSDPPEGVIIENRTTADTYRDIFEIVWKAAKS
jgi:sugar-specific transcriptional regulator TrmB